METATLQLDQTRRYPSLSGRQPRFQLTTSPRPRAPALALRPEQLVFSGMNFLSISQRGGITVEAYSRLVRIVLPAVVLPADDKSTELPILADTLNRLS